MKKIRTVLRTVLLTAFLSALTACGGKQPEAVNPLTPEYVYARAETRETETAAAEETVPDNGFYWDGTALYYRVDGENYSGWMETEEGFRYFRKSGRSADGFTIIQGEEYYFENGVMATGWRETERGLYYFSERGVSQTGWLTNDAGYTVYLTEEHALATGALTLLEPVYTEDGEPVLDENGEPVLAETVYNLGEDGIYRDGVVDGLCWANGVPQTGLFQTGGFWYCADEQGAPLTGWQVIDGSTYHFAMDGKGTVGWYDEDGNRYYFDEESAVMQTGAILVDGLLYYFYSSGIMARNTTHGIYVIGDDGVCTTAYGTITAENLDSYILYLLQVHGDSLWEIYQYIHSNYRYKYLDWDQPINCAIRMLNLGYGPCWDFQEVSYLMITAAGYNAVKVTGTGGYHVWLLVEVEPGVWRHFDTTRMDTQVTVFLLTDEELLACGDSRYKWDPSQYPYASGVPQESTEETAEGENPGEEETEDAAAEETGG